MQLPITPSVTLVLSCTVSKILQDFYAPTHPYSTVILGVFPFYHIAHVGVNVSRCLKLFGRAIILEVIWAVPGYAHAPFSL